MLVDGANFGAGYGAVWLCIKTCYDISKTEVLSDIVCRHAEDVLMQMVLSVFKNVAQKHAQAAQLEVRMLRVRNRTSMTQAFGSRGDRA